MTRGEGAAGGPRSAVRHRIHLALAVTALACGAAPTPPGPVPTRAPAPKATATAAPAPTLSEWRPASFGHVMVPSPIEGDSVDVIFHFHVGKSAEPEYRASGVRAVVAAASHGLFASSYSQAYEDKARFPEIEGEVLSLLKEESGNASLRIGRIALIAWSAGYGAIRKILAAQDDPRIDAVVLLDGIHSPYLGNPSAKKPDMRSVSSLVRFAEAAARGEKLMVVTHSAIQTVGYANTTETTTALLALAGASRETLATPLPAPGGLELASQADRGDFHVRGYGGDDKGAHVAHLRLLEGVLREHLVPRWARPAATR